MEAVGGAPPAEGAGDGVSGGWGEEGPGVRLMVESCHTRSGSTVEGVDA